LPLLVNVAMGAASTGRPDLATKAMERLTHPGLAHISEQPTPVFRKKCDQA